MPRGVCAVTSRPPSAAKTIANPTQHPTPQDARLVRSSGGPHDGGRDKDLADASQERDGARVVAGLLRQSRQPPPGRLTDDQLRHARLPRYRVTGQGDGAGF